MTIMQTMPNGVTAISLSKTDLRHNIPLAATAYEHSHFPQRFNWDDNISADKFSVFDKVHIEAYVRYQDKLMLSVCDITGQKDAVNRVSVVFDGTEKLKCTVESKNRFPTASVD